MPRKKKEVTPRPEGYEILIGYIREFTYNDDFADQMGGHPLAGRCYRIIKDKEGYRIHIGRENNQLGLDGLYLGKKLKSKQPQYKFDIEVVTPTNYLDLGINKEDTKKVVEWLESDNADMWAQLKAESEGTTGVLQQLSDIVKFREEIENRADEVNDAELKFSARPDIHGQFDTRDIEVAQRMANGLNIISDNEPDAFYTIVDLIEYIASTYSDKYNSKEIPNVTKPMLTNSTVGAPMNMYSVMKYAQRYVTPGYEKSYNVRDVFKLIHYGLFELQRRRNASA